MEIVFNHFEQLTNIQLYSILQLRQRVFINEQQSIYDDIDGLDEGAIHAQVTENADLVGYARLRPVNEKGTLYVERVVLHQRQRGKGLGDKLMRAILKHCSDNWPDMTVQLSAQLDALSFYQKLGFTACGEPYDDGGILHKVMKLTDKGN